MRKAGKIIAIIVAALIVIAGVVIGIIYSDNINESLNVLLHGTDSLYEEVKGEDTAAAAATFEAGEYGGIQFDSIDDVVDYYVEVYDATKAETATYIDADGNEATFYAFLGTENLDVDNILVNGSDNSIIDALIPPIVGGLFSSNVYGLPPCSNRTPDLDVDESDVSLGTSRLTPSDIESASVADNGDGTITLTIIPYTTEMSHKGMDPIGNMFNALGAIDETVESISVLSWAEGTTAENCQVHYNGTATVKVDVASGKIVEADYDMVATVDVQHATISVIKDQNASLDCVYTQHFPADDDYLMDTKGISRT